MNMVRERSHMQLRKKKWDRLKIKTYKSRKPPFLRKDLEGSLPHLCFIELLREWNYRIWYGTNFDSHIRLINPCLIIRKQQWGPSRKDSTWLSQGYLKESTQVCGLGPPPNCRPSPTCLDCCLLVDVALRVWPWFLAPAVCELKIPHTVCPVHLYQVPLWFFTNCMQQLRFSVSLYWLCNV